jgi:hypothetical protein
MALFRSDLKTSGTDDQDNLINNLIDREWSGGANLAREHARQHQTLSTR